MFQALQYWFHRFVGSFYSHLAEWRYQSNDNVLFLLTKKMEHLHKAEMVLVRAVKKMEDEFRIG